MFQATGLDFWNLTESRDHYIELRPFCQLDGFCLDDNRLYCTITEDVLERGVDGADYRSRLRMYELMSKAAKMRLLDDFKMNTPELRLVPRVDTRSHLVYVPCWNLGTQVFRCDDNDRLVIVKTLTCVTNALCLSVDAAGTVLIGDATNKQVCLIDGTMNRVMRKLPKPKGLGATSPRCISATKEQILVGW